MKVIGRPQIGEWTRVYPKAKSALQSWLREAEIAVWTSAHDIQSRYHGAHISPGGAVIFPLCAGAFQLEAQICFSAHSILIVGLKSCRHEQLALQLPDEENDIEHRLTSVRGGRHEP